MMPIDFVPESDRSDLRDRSNAQHQLTNGSFLQIFFYSWLLIRTPCGVPSRADGLRLW